jgi:hypothetical protein
MLRFILLFLGFVGLFSTWEFADARRVNSAATLRRSKTADLPITATQTPSCESVDLRPELPPIPEQGDIGWCYAYVAADMLSHKLKVPISAFDTAITYNHYIEGHKFPKRQKANPDGTDITYAEAGYIAVAVNQMHSAGGVCPESVIRSEGFQIRGVGLTPKEALSYTEQMAYRLAELDTHQRNGRCHEQNLIFPKISNLMIADVLDKAANPEKWYEVAKLACQDHRISLDPSLKLMNHFAENATPSDFAEIINQQLNNRNLTAISYDARAIPRKKLLASSDPSNQLALRVDQPYHHASSIVGRKLKDGKCLYLIRNTWGPKCWDIENCEDGYFWVDTEWINKNVPLLSTWIE